MPSASMRSTRRAARRIVVRKALARLGDELVRPLRQRRRERMVHRGPAAGPVLLEPIMKVEIEAPDEFAGTLMGDLSSRRGRVQGTDSKGRTTVINAQVPMAEMLTYGTLLTSMTQGKGSYRMEMDHYDIVPQLVADKILANAKRPVEEEEE